MGPVYVDASAAAKLLLLETESRHLLRLLAEFNVLASSQLLRVELTRAVLRQPDPRAEVDENIEKILDQMLLLDLDEAILGHAARLLPKNLRTLDAIHLASALTIPHLAGMVVYDHRLSEAAAAHGIRVFAPS